MRAFTAIAAAAILVLAGVLRFQHLDWDRGYLFHPDERQILLVASNIAWPSSPANLLSPDSPLNPGFFAYGSFPIYLARLLEMLAPTTNLPSPWQDDRFVAAALTARAVSAALDVGTVLLVFLLGRLLYDSRVGLIAAAGYAFSALAIQLAHFYTVDTLLTFLLVAAFLVLTRYALYARRRDLWLLGALFGLALATKLTAVLFMLPLVYVLLLVALRRGRRIRRIAGDALRSTVPRAVEDGWEIVRAPLERVLGAALVTFLLTQPYVLIDLPQFIADVSREALMVRGWLDVPYTRQYSNTVPFVYPVEQTIVWGLGVPLGVFAWGGAILLAWVWLRGRDWRDGLLLLWTVTFFGAVGGQQVKYVRYLLPIIPFLLLMAAAALVRIRDAVATPLPVADSGAITARRTAEWLALALIGAALLGSAAWAAAFSSVYQEEHPWLKASAWIYDHVPSGATLVTEEWDDSLPVLLLDNGRRREATLYRVLQNPVFDPDDSTKLETLVARLEAADFIILASPRAAAVIPRLPNRYPITTHYYEGLFDGRLGFEPVFGLHPVPRLDGFAFRDDPYAGTNVLAPFYVTASRVVELGRADESLTVYDHPSIIILQKMRALTAEELRLRLTGAR